MPLVDMPLEKLKQYMGVNPCPKDIDEYWDRAICQLDSTDPKAELVPAAVQLPNAECFDLYFTGVGGARIHAKYIRPKDIKKPHPAVLEFHGYMQRTDDFADYLKYISAGFSVAAMDCRGQGGPSEDVVPAKGPTVMGNIIQGLNDNPDKLYYKYVFLDTAQLARVVMSFDEVDENRVAASGASQGGGLTLACASLVPNLKCAAPIYPFLCDYKRVWDMDLIKQGAYVEIRWYFRQFDPCHEREFEIFEKLGYIDLQNIVKRIKCKVLWSCALMDEICPASTQFAAYNKIIAPKSMDIYYDFGHEKLRGASDKIMAFLAENL